MKLGMVGGLLVSGVCVCAACDRGEEYVEVIRFDHPEVVNIISINGVEDRRTSERILKRPPARPSQSP